MSQTHPHSVQTTELPSLHDLIAESWSATKATWWTQFKVGLLGMGTLFLLAIVAIIVGLLLGVSGRALMDASQFDLNNPLALLAGGALSMFIIGVFIAIFMAVAIATQAASYMVVFNYQEKMSARTAFKQGFKFVVPLIVTSLLTCLLILGGFFFFIIPAIAFSILFAMSAMEVIFQHRRPVAALKRSMALVSTHFGDIFLRWIVLMGINMGLSMVFNIFAETDNQSLNGLVALISVITSFVLSFFNFAYSVVLYKQVNAATDPKKESSLTAVVIIAVVGWLIVILAGVSIAKWLGSEAGRQAKDSLTEITEMAESASQNGTDLDSYDWETGKQPESSLTEKQAALLADETFEAFNTHRTDTDLKAWIEDSRLCAYAQRRLEQLTELGRLDDGKGFYEDTASPEMRQAYFSQFPNVSSQMWGQLNTTWTGAKVTEQWLSAASENILLDSAKLTHACVRATPDYMVLVAGGK